MSLELARGPRLLSWGVQKLRARIAAGKKASRFFDGNSRCSRRTCAADLCAVSAMLAAFSGAPRCTSSMLLRAPMRGLAAAAARRAPASGASSAPAPKQFALRSPLQFWGLPVPEGELGVSASTATREELLTYLRQMYQVRCVRGVASAAVSTRAGVAEGWRSSAGVGGGWVRRHAEKRSTAFASDCGMCPVFGIMPQCRRETGFRIRAHGQLLHPSRLASRRSGAWS